MNIDMNSWHYRFNKTFMNDSGAIPKSLCPYFWATAGRLIVASLGISILTMIMFLVGFIAMMGLNEAGLTNVISTALTSHELMAIWMYPVVILVGIICVALCIGGLLGLLIMLITLVSVIGMARKKYTGLTVKERIDASDNIAIAYIRAKHNKICPKLNFTYGEKK